jgi:chemotaxis response regulator CheB
MTESATVSILVLEDFKEWREEIRRILPARPDWKIVYEACDGPDGAQKAAELQPRIVLLDNWRNIAITLIDPVAGVLEC